MSTALHYDRSGVVIEPWLTDQWFCDARVLAAPALPRSKMDIPGLCHGNGRRLFRVAAQYSAMVHFAPVVVGHQIPLGTDANGPRVNGQKKQWPI